MKRQFPEKYEKKRATDKARAQRKCDEKKENLEDAELAK